MDSTQDASNFRNPVRWNSRPVPERVAQRAISNADKQPGGCWISRYSVMNTGYAQVGWFTSESDRGTVLAHRAAWVAANGQVPVGMTIDHLCKERRCVNPDHLRLLSNVENARRNQGGDFPLGACRNGHPYSEQVEITRRKKSGELRKGFTCGICLRESKTRWAANNPEKVRLAHANHYAKKKEVA